MHEYTIAVTIETKAPLTEKRLFEIAAIGGAATGVAGERRIETTLTVEADDLLAAIAGGSEQILKLAPGRLVAAEGMTAEEFDRQEEAHSKLVGVTEIAKALGVSRQRAHALSKRKDFPAPAARLEAGPVWRAADISQFAHGWERKPGRPRASAE